MDWFNGTLEVWFKNGKQAFGPDRTYDNLSVTQAQEMLNSLPKDSVREAIYLPHSVNMVQLPK